MTSPRSARSAGHDAVRAFGREPFAAFPGFTMTAGQIVAGDTAAVIRWHAAGTCTGGPFPGIAPAGRRAQIRGADGREIADGLIRHHAVYCDGPPSPAREADCRASGPAPAEPCWPRSARRPRGPSGPVIAGDADRPGPGSIPGLPGLSVLK